MIHQAFAIKDTKAAAFAPPFFMPRMEAAVRAFTDACSGGDTMLTKHPDDFALYCIGEYDDARGLLLGIDDPRFVITARAAVDGARGSPLPFFGDDQAPDMEAN